jgi:hypothetical protein
VANGGTPTPCTNVNFLKLIVCQKSGRSATGVQQFGL